MRDGNRSRIRSRNRRRSEVLPNVGELDSSLVGQGSQDGTHGGESQAKEGKAEGVQDGPRGLG